MCGPDCKLAHQEAFTASPPFGGGSEPGRQAVRDTSTCSLRRLVSCPSWPMAAAAPVYRRVLKAVQKHVGGGASNQHFRDFVAAEFRAPAGTEADARARLRLAGDYAYLLTSVHHHKVED